MADRESQGERNENARNAQGFGDDMGTRVGRPDRPNRPDASDEGMARLSEDADDRGSSRLEGSILDDASLESQGGRSHVRADGSSMEASSGADRGETLDHTQRAESGMPQREKSQRAGGASRTGADSGMGGEANRGVHAEQGRGASVEHGTDEGPGPNAGGASGSEPLEGRKSEHKPSYGGEGGEPRTSSEQREGQR